MQLEDFTEDQLAALCDIWKLGRPIDVAAFLDRSDIPEETKVRVRNAGKDLRLH